jgi:hypothetical protein
LGAAPFVRKGAVFDFALALTGASSFAAAKGGVRRPISSALDKFKVGEKEKNDLLGILGPMKPDIVTK